MEIELISSTLRDKSLMKILPDIQFIKIVKGGIMNTPTLSCIMKLQISSTATTQSHKHSVPLVNSK